MSTDEVLEWEEEARRVRREWADWRFIESLPPRLRSALRFYIETGDFRVAQRLAGVDYEDFRELLRRANIPIVL
jgi:hypothetical protein